LNQFSVVSTTSNDGKWITDFLSHHWGSPVVVSRGKLYHANELPAFIATEQGERIGLATYSINGSECEIVTLNSVRENQGVGTALVKAVESVARQAGCLFVRLITTNDNVRALRFYQRYGFVLVALHRGAVTRSRTLKPEIPMTGNEGIPIRDEIELELVL
jgi:GNAT superfamily N-acetyltransferase